MGQWGSRWRRQAGRGYQRVFDRHDLGPVQRPRRMTRPGKPQARSVLTRAGDPPEPYAEENPARGEEVIAIVQLGLGEPVADLDPGQARGAGRAGQPAMAAIEDLAPALLDVHLRPEVRQPVRRPGHRDRPEPRRVEREEPD